ncbi:MAG: hypothetical protein ACXWZM_07295 [Solirubrobacterales bacterium]
MRASRTFGVAASAPEATAACISAISLLGWGLVAADRQAGRFAAREDTTKLCCVESPVVVKIQVGGSDRAGTPITLSWKIPGFGPVASRSLRTREAALVGRIRTAIDSAPPREASELS